jgi:hypothetical protein
MMERISTGEAVSQIYLFAAEDFGGRDSAVAIHHDLRSDIIIPHDNQNDAAAAIRAENDGYLAHKLDEARRRAALTPWQMLVDDKMRKGVIKTTSYLDVPSNLIALRPAEVSVFARKGAKLPEAHPE